MGRAVHRVIEAVALMSLAVVSPAAAQERDVQVSVSPRSAAAGDDVQATVTGCDPGQRAQVALALGPGGVIEQGNADGQGVFVAALPVPANADPGEVPVVGQCQDQTSGTDGTDETTLTVVARTPSGDQGADPGGSGGMTELPRTGPTDVLPQAALGAALTAVGAALAFAGRRRRTEPQAL